MDVIELFLRALKYPGWALYVPEKIWHVYREGGLRWERLQSPYTHEPHSFPKYDWGPNSLLPEPFTTDSSRWGTITSTLGFSERAGYYQLFGHNGWVFEVRVCPILLAPKEPISPMLNWDAAMFAGFEDIGGYRLTLPERNARATLVPLVACQKNYSPGEILKAKRRVRDRVTKEDTTAIRVAKFLKLK